MIQVLEERKFPVGTLRLFASERSAGETLTFFNQDHVVELLQENSFNGIDIALFSAGEQISLQFAPIAAQAGAVVIDNSSAFRMNPDVPLVVPEVNPGAVMKHKGIIANPHCSTIQMVVVLKPLHDRARIKRVVVTTFQSVSGKGKEAMDELFEQTRSMLTFQEVKVEVFPHQIAFNCLPHIDTFLDNGYTKEEMKKVNENRKNIEEGRIREDESIPNGLNLWIVADNLRKGAATNAVQIAEILTGNINQAAVSS